MLNLNENEHIFICGQTQSGKTSFAIKLMKEYRGKVLFFNSQKVDTPDFFSLADKNTAIEDLYFGIKMQTDIKIDYRPSENLEIAKKELDFLIKYVVKNKIKILFVIDEIADYSRQGSIETMPEWLARRGLGRGIKGVFISQTPADVSKTITKQCNKHVLFTFNFYDEAYFQRFKIPSNEIRKNLLVKKYSFCIMDGNGWNYYNPIKI